MMENIELIQLHRLENSNHTNKTRKVKSTKEMHPNKRKLIDDLTASNTRLQKELKVIKSVGNCRKDTTQVNVISNLVEKMEFVENQLTTERKYLADLENELTQFPKSLRQKSIMKKKLLPEFPQECTTSEKSRDALQDKLHVANIQLGIEQTKNHELRAKIQSLLSDRKIFNKEYESHIEKLKHGKKVLIDLESSLINSVNLRQNVQQKLEQLNEKENKQKAIQQEEANDLELKKNQETRFRAFFEQKLKEGEIIRQEQRRHKVNEQERENTLLKLVTQRDNISDAVGIQFSDDKVSSEAIIRQIIREDRDIASLFEYLAQLNHELEALREKVLKQEIELEEKMINRDEIEDRQTEHCQHLNRFKNDYTETNIALHDDLETSNRSLRRLFKGVKQCIEITKTDVSPLLKLLGENVTVHEFNYKLFLKSLETKIISLMEKVILEPKPTTKHTDTGVWSKILPYQEEPLNRTATTYRTVGMVLQDRINYTSCAICYQANKNQLYTTLTWDKKGTVLSTTPF